MNVEGGGHAPIGDSGSADGGNDGRLPLLMCEYKSKKLTLSQRYGISSVSNSKITMPKLHTSARSLYDVKSFGERRITSGAMNSGVPTLPLKREGLLT